MSEIFVKRGGRLIAKLQQHYIDANAQFNVTYANTYKLVHNKALDEYYVLYCTKSAPSLGATFQSKTYIQVPVKSFAAVDTRALGFLDVSNLYCTTRVQASFCCGVSDVDL